jgi:hypothetical protein
LFACPPARPPALGAAEFIVLVVALPHIAAADLFGVALPNAHNIIFSFAPVLMAYMAVAYVGMAPPLYMHMLASRKKQLAKAKDD